MNNSRFRYIKNLFFPCFAFSMATGILSAFLITLFQRVAEFVIHLSGRAYGYVRENPEWIPCLLGGAALIGLAASFILTFSHSCRGGGIPTSIAAIRGITSFKWLKSAFVLPFSALLTFLCGLPLGTEGPCVQMGTALGDGVVHVFGSKKHAGWRRYMMTGGASAAFSLVTGAPVTAILFVMEEIHCRFSPLLFSVASLSVLAGQITVRILAHFSLASVGLFHIETLEALPFSRLFIPLVLGVLCGACSVLFTHAYHRIDRFVRITLGKISVKIKFPLIFACIALTGFFCAKILGTGHSLIEGLFEVQTIWYLLIVIFLVRAVFMMIANTAGITGGVFLPTLAFGAIIGSLCAQAFIVMGLLPESSYTLLVVLGMTAFLGANSRIPLTACVFTIEALGGIHNLLAIGMALTASFLIVQISGLDDFTDAIVKAKAHAIHKGKEPHHIEVALTVHEGSFVIDKELRDILWPASCVLLSFERAPQNKGKMTIAAGDVLTVYYKTYDPVASAEEFEVLVGDQPEETDRIMRPT